MKKRDKIAAMLANLGFEPTRDFLIVTGPKTKMDILECWNVGVIHNGKHYEVYSAYTMTNLIKQGMQVVPNYRETCLYGDFVAEPKNPA